MARWWCNYKIVSYFIVIFCISSITPAKLNVPRVLLPLFQRFSTNFTLEVSENGCYKWTSSRPDIVQVIPIEVDDVHHCSIKAVVSAITKEPIRNTVIVLAEEVRTGFVLRCDVIVDVITSLNMVTTTRELFMEEAPEMFEVRADDNQGNKFTTLEGVEFQWSIENLAQSQSANQVLRFITFIDSPYETPTTVAKFDSLGLRGHKVLIEGVKTGAAKVSVQLPHPEYNKVPKIEVVLTVVANLLLDPPDTHILAGDTVKFRLLQMQHGRLDEIPLPSSQYALDVEDTEVIIVDRIVSVVRGVSQGQSRVVLRDRHGEGAGPGVKLPAASVVVTQPAYLRLFLLPHNNWAITVDEPCSIQVQVFDRNNHRIHIGDAVSVRSMVSEEYFRVYSMTRNGTVIDGTTIKVGTVPVTATLESVRAIGGAEVKFKPVISAQEDMLIYPRLMVTPRHVVVPWDPSLTKYELELTASGGDGSYSWRSNNISVVTVSQSGVVKCNKLGETSVIVSMPRNPAIRATSRIDVLPPSHMEILSHILEAPVHKPIILNIVLYADTADENGNLKRVHFTHCQEIQFKVEISNANFYQNVTDHTKPQDKACATVAVVGRTLGTSKVKISYKSGSVLLEASTVVASFSPVEVMHPEKMVTVLALGTSRHIVWKGGPRVWQGRPAEHKRSVASDSPAVTVEEVTSSTPSEFYVYSVMCKELGESNVILTIKNSASNGNFKHTESSSCVKVICAKPRFISFSPEILPNSTCPYSTDSSRIVALTYEPIKILVTITDHKGRVFDNATSLHIDWTLSSKSLGYIQYDGVVILEDKKEYNYLIPLEHYQYIHPKNRTGTLTVEGTVVNYRLQLLSRLLIIPEHPVFGILNDLKEIISPVISNSLTIVLVNASSVTPDRATVFNHPNNKVVLKVTQGSGFYRVYQSSLDIADVRYEDSSKSVEVIPKTDGHLQLTLFDLCLSYKSPVVEIEVSII
ncbi:LOW QUALITY PROTEIN: nuclear pore membrane glycoprotein 210-like [Homalodisca vitripennis]|nr:LOW QUALITY PROTEIN: nuclear pore membrane glycoprotein 210-like [Homalodisca vitripennis]